MGRTGVGKRIIKNSPMQNTVLGSMERNPQAWIPNLGRTQSLARTVKAWVSVLSHWQPGYHGSPSVHPHSGGASPPIQWDSALPTLRRTVDLQKKSEPLVGLSCHHPRIHNGLWVQRIIELATSVCRALECSHGSKVSTEATKDDSGQGRVLKQCWSKYSPQCVICSLMPATFPLKRLINLLEVPSWPLDF